MIKLSKNPKTNYLLNEILLQIKDIENYKEEIKRYIKKCRIIKLGIYIKSM